MSDGELSVEIVPDESAIESMEKKQLEIAGEPDSVDEARQLNESQDERLMIANRKLGRMTTALGKLGIIAATLAVIAKVVGEVFDIGFEDVRSAIVQAIDDMIEAIKSFLPGGKTTQPPSGGEVLSGLGTGFPALLQGNPAPFITATTVQRANNLNSQNTGQSTGNNVNIFTSRDSLTGDSTQQQQQNSDLEFWTQVGGS